MRAPPRTAAITAAILGALAGLAAPAAACPSCALSQGKDTLLFIGAFILVPYVVVSCTVLWIRRILRAEQD
ncbi:MAG: hypothetical protein ACYTG2_15880 [Planctomycetota bacterium]|jgi:hypothetical protein